MSYINKLLEYKFENLDLNLIEFYKEFNFFKKIFDENLKDRKWISIPNKNLFFNKEIMACYPNFLNNFQDIRLSINEGYENILKKIKENEEYSKYNINWDIQTYRESIASFYNKHHPMESDNFQRIRGYQYFLYKLGNSIHSYDNYPNYNYSRNDGLVIPIYRLGNSEDHLNFERTNQIFQYSSNKILSIFLKNDLIPFFISKDNILKEKYEKLSKLVLKFIKSIESEKDFSIEKIISNTTNFDKYSNWKEFLEKIDKERVNIDSYDTSMICDPNGGHWDLYEDNPELYLKTYINSGKEKIYARNPRLDIKKGGIVGIDFGTKSTVVVFQDDRNITLPMRISGNILNKAVENSDYENPTVIEFRNINNFIKDYTERKGRPFTKWEDITVSHTAFQNLVNGNEKSFYSIVSELKQWAGSKKDKLLIKDKKGIEKLLNPYLELEENEIDPIEIYAYYIGSYINNMRNGIYLEYFLSFPVTYEKAIREKILASFEKGIKKSLPKVILEDENIMKKFKVRHGANEPAAYSICALQEYRFDPEDDEKIYYGVFDFGGGTLDFDFGIFREAEDDRYDYELEHFGAGGDRYLGGENILKELAFETFKENINSLREKGVTFTRPEWCNRFIGDETLVDKNGNSRLNTKLLMEKLRGIWEETEEITEPKIKLNLFDKSGEPLAGFELSINIENLKNIISNKIEGGIKNFFIAMEKAFKNDEIKKIYILLAGNSSKHPLVKTLFENYIKEKNMDIEILPALGTEEAYKKLEERKISFDKEDKTKPTGKTGVAYGLLESTADSCIKIINRDEEHNKEINFKYYVGTEKKKKLKPILNPNIDYNDFKPFSYVKSDVFNIYYTTLPEASEGNFLIKDAKRIRIPLNSEYDSDTQIYIKAVGADTIEYAITKKDINEKDYIENGKITLD